MAKYVDNRDICELVRNQESNFINGSGTTMSKYVVTDLYEDASKIYAYLESKHITGETDSKGREKPFFNIVTAARNVYYRATDIDRKNIEIKPSSAEETIPAFLATVHLQNWMRKENFGAFLNDWGMDLAAFNSVVVKFVETEGELKSLVVPWSRLIVDPINFADNVKIETLELTEAQLYQKKGYDKEMVDALCEKLQERELLDRTKQDQRGNYIKLYEIHGNLPLSYLTGKDKDRDTFAQQMHIVSFVASKGRGNYDDFTLFKGLEADDPYMLTSLLPATDGSVSLNGSVKNLFEAQWMLNHSVKNIKDHLDLASKLIFQTSDANFVGRNVLNSIENGDIMIHAINQPLTQANNTSHDITAHESFSQMWKSLSSEINGVSESMLGNTPPSGTAWRQVNALLQESHSLFDLMTENKALYIEQMLREKVIPFLKKKMNTSDEIAATLEGHNITKIDSMFVPQEAIRQFNQEAVKQVIDGGVPSPYQPDIAQQKVKAQLAPLGNQRFFKPSDIPTATWKSVFKDLEWEVEIDITGESTDKNTVLTTLSTALQAVANPMYVGNPQAQLVVSKILGATGVISPLEIAALPPPQPQPMAQGALPVAPPQHA